MFPTSELLRLVGEIGFAVALFIIVFFILLTLIDTNVRKLATQLGVGVLVIGGLIIGGYIVYTVVQERSLADVIWGVAVFLVITIATLFGGRYLIEQLPNIVTGTVDFLRERVLSRYLRGLVEDADLQAPNQILWEERSRILLNGIDAAAKNRYRVIKFDGEFRAGKTYIIWQTIKQIALHKRRYTPFYVNWDELVERRDRELANYRDFRDLGQGRVNILESWLLQAELKRGNLCVFIDGSSPVTYSYLFGEKNLTKWGSRLVQFAKSYYEQGCLVVISTPVPDLPDTYNPLYGVAYDIQLRSLSDGEVETAVYERLESPASEEMIQKIAANSVWRVAACKPYILFPLIQYYSVKKAFPKDLPTLFDAIYRPADVPADLFDNVLANIVDAMLAQDGSLPANRVNQIIDAEAKSGDMRSIKKRMAKSFVRTAPDKSTRVKFRQSDLFAYALAKAWEKEHADIKIQRKNDRLANEAFFMFSSMFEGVEHTARLQEYLGSKTNFIRELALDCILAKPINAWPESFLSEITFDLLDFLQVEPQISDGYKPTSETRSIREAARSVWKLLETFEIHERANLIAQMLALKSYNQLEAIMGWIIKETPLENTELLLFYSDWDTTLSLANFLVSNDLGAFSASTPLNSLYYYGPPEKRSIAVIFLGKLSKVADSLITMLNREDDPNIRCLILESLVTSGADSVLTLVNLLSNPDEHLVVRKRASQLLITSQSHDIYSAQVAYEIVRLKLSLQLPEQIRGNVDLLYQDIKDNNPDVVAGIEKVLNPYIVGKPVTDENLFIGRDEIIHKIRAAVQSSNNRILSGERRIGKTSILHKSLKMLEDEFRENVPVIPVFINLESLDSNGGSGTEEALYTYFISEILEKLEYLQVLSDHSLEFAQIAHDRYTFETFRKSMLGLINFIVEKYGKSSRLVLLVDEADKLKSQSDDVLSRLRKVFSDERIKKTLVVIMAGTLQLRQGWQSKTSPFYNIFEFTNIPPLSADHARMLIVNPVENRIFYEPDAVELILRYSNLKPYDIQCICHDALNEVLNQHATIITRDIAERVCKNRYGLRADIVAVTSPVLDSLCDWLDKHQGIAPEIFEQQAESFEKELRKAIQGVFYKNDR